VVQNRSSATCPGPGHGGSATSTASSTSSRSRDHHSRSPLSLLTSRRDPAQIEGALRPGRRRIPEGARSASPGLLENNPWRRLTISEHRGHLLPDAEDVSCRGAPTVGPHAEMRQRIYRCASRVSVTHPCSEAAASGSVPPSFDAWPLTQAGRIPPHRRTALGAGRKLLNDRQPPAVARISYTWESLPCRHPAGK
jgi:hypothetical protein